MGPERGGLREGAGQGGAITKPRGGPAALLARARRQYRWRSPGGVANDLLAGREAGARAALASANRALRDAAAGLGTRVAERTRDLTAREPRFRVLFDSTFQSLALLDREGRLLETNETALAFLGLTRAEAIGQPNRPGIRGTVAADPPRPAGDAGHRPCGGHRRCGALAAEAGQALWAG